MKAYPLQWPQGWKRTARQFTRKSNFKSDGKQLSMYRAQQRLNTEIRHLHAQRSIVSTNMALNLDGSIKSRQREPEDTGVALYWRMQADQPDRVIAIDIYDRVEDNIAAIAACLESLRRIRRHGGREATEQVYRGLELPAPGQTGAQPWYVVLGVEHNCTKAEADYARRSLLSEHHEDKPGGSKEMTQVINQAWAEALDHFNKAA